MFDLFSSIKDVWAIWGLSLSFTFWLTVRGLRAVRWPHLRRIAVNDDGAAYTLSYVMVVPLYIFFMCLVVETTLLILAKFGANHAAYAGARSAIVHYSDHRLGDAEGWAKWSATKAFVPFANGVVESGDGAATGPGLEQYAKDVDNYLGAYRAYAGPEHAKDRYMRAKYQYASKNLNCRLTVADVDAHKEEPWLVDITANLEYRYSFHVPGVALLMGEEDANGRFYKVHGTATLQSEAPKNEKQSLGIKYETWRDKQPWE